MDEMQDKLNAVLGNPDMMAQIMSMAQSLGGGASSPPPAAPLQPATTDFPEGLDLATITKLAGMMGSANVDKDQRTLLLALRPYLTHDRIGKLERAMRAAKLAGVATTLLSSGFLSRTGR